MMAALGAAREGAQKGEVPVGAAVVVDGEVISTSHNETIARRDLTQHAEIIAMRAAMESLRTDRLDQAVLCVTLEPCAQCAGAIVLARVHRLVFGAFDPKAGMAGSLEDLVRHPKLNHRPEVVAGAYEDECAALLTEFFADRRLDG
jgi:tRNA(Arg) A34 adenosine deaminase TadA